MAGEHKKSMRLGSMFSEIIPLASFFIVNQSHGLYMGALAALVTALAMRSEDEARAYLDDVSMQLVKDGAEVDTKSSTFHRKPKEKEGNKATR